MTVAKNIFTVIGVKILKIINRVVRLNGIERILDQTLIVATAKLLGETHISRKVSLVGGSVVLVIQKRMEEASVASVGIKNASSKHKVGLLACFKVDVSRGPEYGTRNV